MFCYNGYRSCSGKFDSFTKLFQGTIKQLFKLSIFSSKTVLILTNVQQTLIFSLFSIKILLLFSNSIRIIISYQLHCSSLFVVYDPEKTEMERWKMSTKHDSLFNFTLQSPKIMTENQLRHHTKTMTTRNKLRSRKSVFLFPFSLWVLSGDEENARVPLSVLSQAALTWKLAWRSHTT